MYVHVYHKATRWKYIHVYTIRNIITGYRVHSFGVGSELPDSSIKGLRHHAGVPRLRNTILLHIIQRGMSIKHQTQLRFLTLCRNPNTISLYGHIEQTYFVHVQVHACTLAHIFLAGWVIASPVHHNLLPESFLAIQSRFGPFCLLVGGKETVISCCDYTCRYSFRVLYLCCDRVTAVGRLD